MVRKTEDKPKPKENTPKPPAAFDSSARIAASAAEAARNYALETAELAKLAIESNRTDKLEEAIMQLLNKPEHGHKPCRVIVHRASSGLIDYLDIVPIKKKLN
jgi:hypothetical protein